MSCQHAQQKLRVVKGEIAAGQSVQEDFREGLEIVSMIPG